MKVLEQICNKLGLFKPRFPAKLQKINARQAVIVCLQALLSLAIIPALLLLYLYWSGGIKPLFWKEVPCLITKSTLLQNSPPSKSFSLEAEVEYSFGGKSVKTHSGDALNISIFEETKELTHTLYKAQTTSRCFVDPKTSEHFIIGYKREEILSVLFTALLIFPIMLPLVLFRLGPVKHYLRDRFGGGKDVLISSYSIKVSQETRIAIIALFCSVAAIVVVSGSSVVPHYLASSYSQLWQKKECTLIEKLSEKTKKGKDKFRFVYGYTIAGKYYRADNFYAFNLESNNTKASDFISPFNIGDAIDCYVNIDNPLYVKLSSKQGKNNILHFLQGICVTLILAGFLLFSLKFSYRMMYPTYSFEESTCDEKQRRKLLQWFPNFRHLNKDQLGNISSLSQAFRVLKPFTRMLPIVGVMGIAMVASCIYVIQNSPSLIVISCLLMLVMVACLLGELWKRRSALPHLFGISPTIELEMAPRRLVLGKKTNISWSIKKGRKNYSALRFVLRGKERRVKEQIQDYQLFNQLEKEKKDKKEPKIEEHVFFEEEIIQTELKERSTEGSLEVNIPDGLMHTFHTPHFSVLWAIEVLGTERGEEKLVTNLDIEVLPKELL